MAFENYAGSAPVTFPTATTGLPRWRFAKLSGANVVLGTSGDPIVGVIVDGTTGSTSTDNISCSVQIAGIAKVSAPASTLSAGDAVAVTANGQAQPADSTDVAVGIVVAGSSGGAGRYLSIQLMPVGQ